MPKLFRAGQILILLFCLGLTLLVAFHEKGHTEILARLRFDGECYEVQTLIRARFDDFTRVLLAGAAYFDASDAVSRQQWKVFTTSLGLETNLSGIQGIGFSVLIQPDQLSRHTDEVRGEGFPSYMVWPERRRPIYSSIFYLEPFTGRNLRSFGYDMLSEPVRRSAMEAARDSGLARLSGKVSLVQDREGNQQSEILLYQPVYKHGMPKGSIEERRAAIAGWVYSPHRMTDLMSEILAAWTAKYLDEQLTFQIHSGSLVSDSSLLFDSASLSGAAARSRGTFSRTSSVYMAGQEWTLSFSKAQGGAFASENTLFWHIMFTGILISLLLFAVFHVLLRTRNQAHMMADRLTGELRESEGKYRILFDNEILTISIFDRETFRLIDVNEAYARLYGFGREELIGGMTIHDISAKVPFSSVALAESADEAMSFIPLRWHRKKDGTVFPVEIVGGPYSWQGRRVMFSQAHDISNRLAIEEALKTVSTENRSLLSELQHRVKNSFNMISALVSLTIEEVDSVEARQALSELEGRVRTISQLYSMLYQSGSFSEVRLDTYCSEVVTAISAFKGRVRFRSELEELMVRAKIAVPLALILTELLTNCIKYAFPGNRPGQILISLRRTEVGAELSVRDDGVGLPEGFDPRGQAGMGLQLILGLTGQIGGDFSMKGAESGTAATLSFPLAG
ncbi:MAG: CHASE domain-containing protein [Rectinemataceae bacterium]